MAERITLDGLKESMDELVRLTNVLKEAREEFIKAADASTKASESVNEGAKNFKEFSQTAEKVVEVNTKVNMTTKTVLETTKERRKTEEELAKSIKGAMKAVSDLNGTLSTNAMRVNELKAENAELAKRMKMINTEKVRGRQRVASYTAAIEQNRQAINDLNRTMRNQIKEMNASEGSINQMRAQLNQLTQVYDNLSKTERNSDLGATTRQAMKDLSDELKILEGETGRFQRNVGNYPATMAEVSTSIKAGFRDVMNGNVQKGLTGMRNGLLGVATAGRALIATPIGVVLMAIAGAVALVSAGLKAVQTAMNRSEESSNKLSTALAPFKGILEMLINAFGELGKILIDVIVVNLELSLVALQKFTGAIEVIARLSGFGGLADGIRDFNDMMDGAIDRANELSDLEAELVQLKRQNKMDLADMNAEMRKQSTIATDFEESLENRYEATKKLQEVQKEITKAKREELHLELQILNVQIENGNKSTEILNRRAEIIANITNLNAENWRNERTVNRLRRRIVREGNREERARLRELEAERKRIEDERKRRAEEERRERIALHRAMLDNFVLTNEQIVKFDEDFLEEQLDNYRKFVEEKNRLEIESLELQAGTTYAEAVAKNINERSALEQNLINDIIRLNRAKDAELRKLDEDYLKFQEDIDKKTHDSLKKNMAMRLAYAVANGEELKDIERDYYNELYQLEIKELENKTGFTEQEIIDKIESNEILVGLEKEYADRVIEQRKRISDWKEEDRENEIKSEQEKQNELIESISKAIGYESELRQVQKAYNDMMRAQELEDEQALADSKLAMVASVANLTASIAGKESAFGKALAITGVAINTALAVSKVLAEAPLLAPFLVPGIIALGLAQSVKIASTNPPKPPQFEKGVTNSSYEGIAIVDEKGAELHFDKQGNLKSFGQDDGARFSYVEKGDTIIPAHKSKRYMDAMNDVMPNLASSLVLNGLLKAESNKGIEKKLDKVVEALSNKENKSYLDLNDNFIIEVTEKNGSTYQRLVKKIGHKNMKQTRLW